MANAPSLSNHEDMLVVGANVRIVDLVAAPQYNKMVGIVRSFQPDTGRYDVELSKNKKHLGLKPEKLVVTRICSKCCKKEYVAHCGCHRCELPYCSTTCRDVDWKNKHKAECIPKDLPEPPEPVLDSDTGDEVFEASRKYIEMATEAGNDGRWAEQIQMLESFIAKDDQQPAAFVQLFQRYGVTGNVDKAFANLQRAVDLLVDPRLELASDPQSVTLLPVQPACTSPSYVYRHFIQLGTVFIKKHRVIGRSGSELDPDVDVLEKFVFLCGQGSADDPVLSNNDLSELHYVLGNIYRKSMKNLDRAVGHLRLSDRAMAPENYHNFEALLLIPEVFMYEASKATDPTTRDEKMQAAVDSAREVQKLLTEKDEKEAYPGDILLGTMMYNQCMFDIQAAEQNQARIKEIYNLLAVGHNKALEKGSQVYMAKAKRILDDIGID